MTPAELQNIWISAIQNRLSEGPASTNELAAACGVKGARYYHRFRKLLCAENRIERFGMTTGPTGHQNIVWRLVK